jgi:hypothetical protein
MAAKKQKIDNGSPAKAAGGAIEAFNPTVHGSMLNIPTEEPQKPEAPTEQQIMWGQAEPLKQYIGKMTAHVVWKLSKFLFDHPKVRLREPLFQLKTPISGKDLQPGAPTGFKEPFNLQNCADTLQACGLYEASLTLWQFDHTLDEVDSIPIGLDSVTWKQFQACADFWAKDRLNASAGEENKARLIFEEFIPTSVKSVECVANLIAKNAFFRNLPACGGSAQLWSLIHALGLKLSEYYEEETDEKAWFILRLFEASLNVTCRMRLNITEAQVRLDQISYMDVVRIAAIASGAVSFVGFCLKVLTVPEITGNDSGPELLKKMEAMGITFKGKPCDKNIAQVILNVAKIFDCGDALESIHFLENADPNILGNEYSKLSRVLTIVKKICQPDEWKEGAAIIFDSMAVSVLSGDQSSDAFNTDFLAPVGRRGAGVGYAQTMLTAMKFKKWFMDDIMTQAASGASTGLTLEGLMKLKGKCASMRNFWAHFSKIPSSEEEPSLQGNTQDKFDQFKVDNFPSVQDQHAADFMFKVCTNQFYKDFHELSARGERFADMFQIGCECDGNEGSLLSSWIEFRGRLTTAPISLQKPQVDFQSAFDDQADSDHVEKLYKQVIAMRKAHVTFTEMDFAATDAWKVGGKASRLLQRSKFQRSKGVPGKENSLILLKAEFFPNKAFFVNPDAHKGPAVLTDALKEAAKWSLKSRLANTIALFSNGRSRKIARAFEDIVEAETSDESRLFFGDVLFSVHAKGDPRFPRRKCFGSLENRDSLTGVLPVAKVRMSSKGRTHYSACGEKSTYASTYSPVGVRPWLRLPKLTLEDKEQCLNGITLPQYSDGDTKALQNGHPLFLNELWELEMYLALFQDMCASHVFDLAPGSGAAAMAAAILRIQYEGLAMSKGHCDWLEKILDKAMFAIIVDSKDAESVRIKGELTQYFNANIDEARGLMASGAIEEEDDEDEDGDGEGEEGEAKA